MNELIAGIFAFIGGLLTCSIITKLNKQENKFLNIFGSKNKVNQKNENDKHNS